MTASETIANFLQTELDRILGHVPVVEQVDCVVCECKCCVMAYVYHDDGDCTPLLFKRPQVLDPATIEQIMLRTHATVH